MMNIRWRWAILALAIWLLSPSFYGLWQEASPVHSPALPPLSWGQHVLLAPQLALEYLGYWLWPFDREPLVLSLAPKAVLRSGLFHWLLLVIVLRFAWRLRRVEPWIFRGLALALLALVPFSGPWPALAIAFNPWPVCLAGLPLAWMVAILLQHAWTERHSKPPAGHAWALAGLGLTVWALALIGNNAFVVGRSWEGRLNRLEDRGQREAVVAVEIARQWTQDERLDEAEALILRCGQAMPWYGEVPVVKASILLERGQPGAAQAHWAEALRLVPGHPTATPTPGPTDIQGLSAQ